MKTEAASQHIEVTPALCAGKPRIAGHRITVANIVVGHKRLGKSADDIATEYELALAEVYAALTYYLIIVRQLTNPLRRERH